GGRDQKTEEGIEGKPLTVNHQKAQEAPCRHGGQQADTEDPRPLEWSTSEGLLESDDPKRPEQCSEQGDEQQADEGWVYLGQPGSREPDQHHGEREGEQAPARVGGELRARAFEQRHPLVLEAYTSERSLCRSPMLRPKTLGNQDRPGGWKHLADRSAMTVTDSSWSRAAPARDVTGFETVAKDAERGFEIKRRLTFHSIDHQVIDKTGEASGPGTSRLEQNGSQLSVHSSVGECVLHLLPGAGIPLGTGRIAGRPRGPPFPSQGVPSLPLVGQHGATEVGLVDQAPLPGGISVGEVVVDVDLQTELNDPIDGMDPESAVRQRGELRERHRIETVGAEQLATRIVDVHESGSFAEHAGTPRPVGVATGAVGDFFGKAPIRGIFVDHLWTTGERGLEPEDS
ncbi:hypothetical protein AC249_AIPGENE13288, partial [Exaiptasia diaphana]